MHEAALATGSADKGMPGMVDGGAGIALPAGGQELYLEVEINQAATGQIARFVISDGRLFAEPATLRALGLTWPGNANAGESVALDSLPGVSATYDAAGQRLQLFVPVAMLPGSAGALGYTPPPAPALDPETRAPGLLLNYDAFAQGDDRIQTLSGWYELRLFGTGPGVWRNSGVMRTGRGADDMEDSVRLDTSWQLDFPEPMVSINVGDGISSQVDWTRPTRFGGVRVSRNFSLQPYRVTVPLASFAGEATLPSTVDLLINGIRQSQQQVGPGQFRIDSTPILNGAGQAQMVITDINGQTRTIAFSLYNARQLLQAGLSDWSVEAGKVRRDYGLRSFSYVDDPMASGSFRYGATDWFTIESHAETSHGLDMGGIGGLWLLGRQGGVVGTSYAASHSAGGHGDQYAVGYQWQGRHINVDLSTLRRDRAFRDVASLEGSLLPLRSDLAFAGVSIGSGQLAASYVRQDLPDQARNRYVNLSWSQSSVRGRFAGASISITLSRDLEGGTGTGGNLYLAIPFDRQYQAWTTVQKQDSGGTTTVGASRSAGIDRDDWGWRVQASAGEQAGGQAELNRLAGYGQWRVGAQYWHDGQGNAVGYANASGGLLLMQGRLFPMRQPYDAFAMVSTDGIPGVPVMLENRLIGTTDAHGLLLVTPLNAWQQNELSIDPLVLPAYMNVGRTRTAAVPATASGMLARFPMRPVVAVQMALRGADGQWLAPGTQLHMDGGGEAVAVVGYDGLVYLENPHAGGRLAAHQASREVCSVSLPAQLPERGWVDLGELPCR
jgi:outer membrane usher protein